MIRSPKPVPCAYPPSRQKGISAPSVAAISRSRSIGQCSPHRVFTASNVAAASADPPPNPAPTGMCLSTCSATSGSRPAALAIANNASTAWLRRMSLPLDARSPRCSPLSSSENPLPGVLAVAVTTSLTPMAQYIVSSACPAAPFLMGGPYVQRQIGFRGNRDLHRVQRPGWCRFRGCYMTADGPMRGDAWRTPHLTRCR